MKIIIMRAADCDSIIITAYSNGHYYREIVSREEILNNVYKNNIVFLIRKARLAKRLLSLNITAYMMGFR